MTAPAYYKLTNIAQAPRVIYDHVRKPAHFMPGETKVLRLHEEDYELIHERALCGLSFTIEPAAPKVGKIAVAPPPAPEPVAEAADATDPAPAKTPRRGRRRRTADAPAAPQAAPTGTDAEVLLIQAESGMPWFKLRQDARRLLGKAWPGAQAKRADVIEALRQIAG